MQKQNNRATALVILFAVLFFAATLFGCAEGDPGPQGPQGIQGDKGDPGEAGATGQTGDQGEKGDPGPQGPQGIQGEKGDKGEPGETGATGPAGQDGHNGTNGTNGRDGTDGQDGEDGKDGEDGQDAGCGSNEDCPELPCSELIRCHLGTRTCLYREAVICPQGQYCAVDDTDAEHCVSDEPISIPQLVVSKNAMPPQGEVVLGFSSAFNFNLTAGENDMIIRQIAYRVVTTPEFHAFYGPEKFELWSNMGDQLDHNNLDEFVGAGQTESMDIMASLYDFNGWPTDANGDPLPNGIFKVCLTEVEAANAFTAEVVLADLGGEELCGNTLVLSSF